jgi:hypothetical protein
VASGAGGGPAAEPRVAAPLPATATPVPTAPRSAREEAASPREPKAHARSGATKDRFGLPAAPSAARGPESVDRVPKTRLWLFALLGAAALAFFGVLAWTLLSEDKPPQRRPRPSAPSATPRGPASTPAAAPPAASSPRAEQRGAGAALGGRRVERAAGFGAIEVMTGDARGQFFLDGKFRGQGRRVELTDVPAGRHRAHVVVGGKPSPERELQLAPGQRLRLSF